MSTLTSRILKKANFKTKTLPMLEGYPTLDHRERQAMDSRFSKEGLSVHGMSDEQKLTHVWRWLGDAESNCLSLRGQVDKLHKRYDQDINEVENYVEKVWLSTSDKIKTLEFENQRLQSEIDDRSSCPYCMNCSHNRRRRSRSSPPVVTSTDDHLSCSSDCDEDDDDDGHGKRQSSESADVRPSRCRRLSLTSQPCHPAKTCTNCCHLQELLRVLQKDVHDMVAENSNLRTKLSHLSMIFERMKKDVSRTGRSSHPSPSSSSLSNASPSSSTTGIGTSESASAGSGQQLESEVVLLRQKLEEREVAYQDLLVKYQERKEKYRDDIQKMRTFVEEENKKWQRLFRAANTRKRQAIQQLDLLQKNMSPSKTATNTR